MISVEDVVKARDQGLKLISELPTAEKEMLQAYCYMTGTFTIEQAAKNNSDAESMVTNAVQYGIALGLGIKVEDKQVKVR